MLSCYNSIEDCDDKGGDAMGYRARRRRRRMRLLAGICVLLLSAVVLVSCVAGSNVVWVRRLLGFDVTDYESESPIGTVPEDGEICSDLCARVGMIVGNTVDLQEFQGSAQAVKLYRDAILNSMLTQNYAQYTGDRRMIARVESAYPNLTASTLIPEEDFKNTVIRCFGGTDVGHADGVYFRYLEAASCYLSAVDGGRSKVDIRTQAVEETEHTYRLQFVLSDGEETSPVYTAVFVKREAGDCYLRSISF